MNYAKFLRTPFLTEHLQWLPLQACNLFEIFQHNCSKLGLDGSAGVNC